MSEYIITTKQIEELNKANCGMQIVTSLPNVVRCRDCKHRAGANVQAVVSDLCMWLDIIVKPDGFCAWGEKRTKLDDARNVQ